ncbi:LysR substrate-binding domain-containing protein [Escherichia coli]
MDFNGRNVEPAARVATGRAGSGDDLRYPAAQSHALFADVGSEVRLVLAPDHPLWRRNASITEDLASETLLIYPVQRSRLDVWRQFLQPAGVSPSLKSVDKHLIVD